MPEDSGDALEGQFEIELKSEDEGGARRYLVTVKRIVQAGPLEAPLETVDFASRVQKLIDEGLVGSRIPSGIAPPLEEAVDVSDVDALLDQAREAVGESAKLRDETQKALGTARTAVEGMKSR